MKSVPMIASLVEAKNEEGLKRLSQQMIQNAWYKIRFHPGTLNVTSHISWLLTLLSPTLCDAPNSDAICQVFSSFIISIVAWLNSCQMPKTVHEGYKQFLYSSSCKHHLSQPLQETNNQPHLCFPLTYLNLHCLPMRSLLAPSCTDQE
jgi:hypothetical protein